MITGPDSDKRPLDQTHGKSYFGYKDSADADKRYKLVRKIKVSTASEHDTLHFDEILTLPTRIATFWRTRSMSIASAKNGTELDFNGQEADGLGPLNYEARRGMYLHPTYAVTPGREPLGVLDAWMWARERRDADGARHGQKESARWIEGYERVAEMAAKMVDTRLVYVADREGDLVAIMRRARELDTPVDWLVRARHNRCLPDGEGDKLWAHTSA
jgi:hypothetical protein